MTALNLERFTCYLDRQGRSDLVSDPDGNLVYYSAYEDLEKELERERRISMRAEEDATDAEAEVKRLRESESKNREQVRSKVLTELATEFDRRKRYAYGIEKDTAFGLEEAADYCYLLLRELAAKEKRDAEEEQ